MLLPEFKRRFARRIRELREARGLRQDELEMHGIAWKSMQKLEYGQTDPKVSTMLKLAEAFGLDLAALLDFDRAVVPTKPEREEDRPPRAVKRR